MAGYDSIGSLGTASNPFATTSAGTGAAADQVQGNVAAGSTDTGNPVKIGGVVETAAYGAALTDGQRRNLLLTQYGWAKVAPAFPQAGTDAFTNTLSFMGNTGLAPQLLANANYYFNGTTWDRARGDASGAYVTSIPSLTAPALGTHSRISSADINAQTVKASKAVLYAFQFFNTTAAAKYVKLYNKASAPAPATDTALIVRRLMIPANGILSFHAEEGLGAFTSGLSYVITGAAADADTTAIAAGDVLVNIDYI